MSEKDQPTEKESILHSLIDEQDSEQIASHLEEMHPADIAHWLESLPSDEREVVWPQLPTDITGEVLLNLNEELRGSLMRKMDHNTLRQAAENLDTDDLADIIPEMPLNVTQEPVSQSLPFAGTFNQTWNVCHYKGTVVTIFDDSQMGLQGGKAAFG